MNARPAISVAIALYNKESYVGEAVASALGQSFADIEVLVIDDGSTDNSVGQLRKFDDPRLVLIQQANAGVAAARNRACKEAGAPLIAFLDADDVWTHDHLMHLLALSRLFPQAKLFGNRFKEFSSSPPQERGVEPVRYMQMDDYFSVCATGSQPFFTSSCMARRADILAIGGFPEGHSRGEDLAVWLKLAATAPVAVSNYIGCGYRRGDHTLTARPLAEPDISMLTIDELVAQHPEWPLVRQRAAREYYNRIALAHALDALVAGGRTAAINFLQLSSNTKAQRLRWWQIKLMTLLPRSLRNFLLRLRTP